MEPRYHNETLGEGLNVSHVAIWRPLQEKTLYSYHLKRVQCLMRADFPVGDKFLSVFPPEFSAVLSFISVLYIEGTFRRDGIFSNQNQHQ